MKILHVTSDWKWTGPAEPMWTLGHGLRGLGHRVDLACPAAPAQAERSVAGQARSLGHAPVLELARGRGIAPWNPHELRDVRGLRRTCEQGGYDVVHVWHSRAHGLALRALGMRPGARGAALVRAHSDGRTPAPVGRWLLSRGCDGLLCTSRACARSHAGANAHMAVRAHPGAVDTQRFRPPRDEDERARARVALGVGPERAVVGIVARVQPHRRFDLVLEMIEGWVARDPQAPRFAILGRGTRFDELVRVPVVQRRLGAHVSLPGHSYDDYALRLRGLDALLFLVPGSDGGCRAVQEAAASGVPCVASRRGALPELVEEGVTGYCVDEQPGAIASALAHLVGDAARRAAFGRVARRRACDLFAPERYAREVESLYGSVLSVRAQSSSAWSATNSR